MKRRFNISVMLFMAIFIAWMGTGKVMLTCLHSETTRMLFLSDMCDGGCSPDSDCMLTQVVSLSPQMPVASLDVDFHAPVMQIAPFLISEEPLFQSLQAITSECPHPIYGSPPRDLLYRISVLRL